MNGTNAECDSQFRNGRVIFAVTVGVSLRFLAPAVRELSRDGWDIHIVCSPIANRTAPRLEATIHEIAMARAYSPVMDLRAMGQWIAILRRLKPDVVVGATPKAGLLAMVAARIANVPVRVLHVWGARWDGMAGLRALILRFWETAWRSVALRTWCVSQSRWRSSW